MTTANRFRFRVWNDEEKRYEPFDNYNRGILEHPPTDIVVEQSTGLADDAGIEVFESDILLYGEDGNYTMAKNRPVVVEWCHSPPGFDLRVYQLGFNHAYTEPFPADLAGYKVIGNIHTHPELAK